MNKGHSAAWELEWGQAAEFYRQAQAEFPDDEKAMSYLASALFELQDFDQALQTYQKVAEAAPDDPLPMEKIAQILEYQGRHGPGAEIALRAGELHLRNGDTAKAIENWTRTITLNPEHLRARSRLAMTYEKMGRIPQAVNQYLVVASLLQHAGNRDRSLELVRHILTLMPDSSEAKQALALLNANQPLPKPAHKTSKIGGSLIGRKPSLPEPEVRKEDLASDLDPISDARQRALSSLASLMFEQPGAEVFEENRGSMLTQITRGTGPLSRAKAEHSTILLHLTQAVDYQTRKDDQRAVEALEQAIDSGLDNAAAYFDIGYLKSKAGRYESALRNLQNAAKHPDYALASLLLMAQTFQRMGRYQQSAIQFLEALRLADTIVVGPADADNLHQLYEPLIDAISQEQDEKKHQQLSESIEQLLMKPDWHDGIRRARTQLPSQAEGLPPAPVAELLTDTSNGAVVDKLSNILDLARRGLHRPAMEEAFHALQYSPAYLPLHTVMGEILLQQDLIQQAISKFNVVARAYTARGESVRSIDLYRKITRLSPLDLAARQRLIEQLTAAGRVEATLREYLDLGDVYYRLAELDKARSTYERALNVARQSAANNSWTVEILHHLADIDMQRLDWRRAMRLFHQILEFSPGDVKAAANMIGLHLRIGQETEALVALGNQMEYFKSAGATDLAIELLEELQHGNPDHIAIQRTLAEQYQRAGRNQDAVQVWSQVANQLIDEGDRGGAVQALQAIIILGPENVADYERMLAELEEGGA